MLSFKDTFNLPFVKESISQIIREFPNIYFVFVFNSKIWQVTKVSVSGGYERLSTNGRVQGFEYCTMTNIRYNALSNAAQEGEAQLFFSATLAQTFNNRSSRLDWCGNYCPSPRRTFHSSRRSGRIIRCFLLFFKGAHGLVVPPRHGSFLLQKKN